MMKHLRNSANALAGHLRRAVMQEIPFSNPTIVVTGVVGSIAFPLYYFIWEYMFPQPYENLTLRLLGTFLFLPCVFINKWPRSLRRWLPVYWYLTIIYIAPFFFTFMLLMNDLSMVWSMSTMAAMFLLVLLVNDWLFIFAIYVIGTVLAFFAAWLYQPLPDFGTFLVQLPIYVFALITGSVANYKQALLQRAKLDGMLTVSRNIAHELRTPLLGIRSGTEGLQKYLPALFQGYEAAREAKLPVPVIRRAHYELLQGVLGRIEDEASYANTMIDMLLINAGKPTLDLSEATRHSMRECVETALQRYPFRSEADRGKVRLHDTPDFLFHGSSVLLMHVCFNLLKNALYFIARAGKGEVEIWTEPGERENRLYFRDTGAGIPPESLPHIFDRFYTTLGVGQGTGIGLPFCRMVAEGLRGTLTCRSVYGEYAEFMLTLPRTGDVRQ